ncbi:hypothetical protein [Brevundimonas sp. SPF441]|uniref:hypothetical protein n=1 Tax=Brevundimonas sp. SPF441 TaxID=2663795 RepID=UPI00129E056C|nr:hypothetical protein [Brevundimonas sp. SPF441]MRL69481.1 hypothetical protein [Brevundimonas sp. SPF441]
MSGFLPVGIVPLDAVRDIWGVDKLGRYLASGAVVAYVRDRDGQLVPAAPSGWLDDGARAAVEAGALIGDAGERFPLLVESRVAGHSLDALLAAAESDRKRREAQPTAANDAATPVSSAAAEGRARKAFLEMIRSADGKMTKEEAFAALRRNHPGLSKRGFEHRIWATEAPEAWRRPGRRAD